MAEDASDKRRRSKKKRSSLLTWKKKFNIKKRFTNKLPVHRRHVRSLMSSWSLSDVRSVLTQYEITTMLKQLSLMADKSRLPSSKLGQDIGEMFRTSSCYDMILTCCGMNEEDCLLNHEASDHKHEFKVHQSLVSNRWPYLRGVVKSQLVRQRNHPMEEHSKDSTAAENNPPRNQKSPNFLKIHLNEITPEKLSEIIHNVYHESSSSNPRKLLPLPTTDDSLHIRNTRGKQAFRYTVFECDPPPVIRRSVVRRKHNKHRFSMDERILSHQHPIPSSSKVIQSPKLSPGEIFPPRLHNLDKEPFVPKWCSNERRYQTEKPILNSIQDDILKMYQDAKSGSGDVKIIFSCDSSSFTSWMTPHVRRRDFSNHYQAWISHYESSHFFPSPSREWQDPLYCHKIILASRSTYFKRLIERQVTSPTWLENGDNSTPTLEIDGLVIPPRYMGAVLYTMYTDKVDIFRIYERIGQGGMPMGGLPNHFHLRDAMMLHHIGCFIEFPKLVSGCEEFIVESLDQNNLPQILHWASLPHGSQWVTRQVNNFIRERFTELLSTGVLFELSASQIVEVLKSDFVNASELDILKCALRWGEHELLRRIEEREPNLLTHTAHSVSRSKTASARRRELIASRIEELHECTAPILACVRMQHLLPPNHELFANAVKRGVISRPPTDLLENTNDRDSGSRQWIKSRVDFVPPRLFQPYMDETRNILDERFAQENDNVSLRSMHSFSRDQTWSSMRHHVELAGHGIPDALYMVGQARLPTNRHFGYREMHSNYPHTKVRLDGGKPALVKYIGDYHPVPEVSAFREMMARERELRSTYIVNKVLRACIDCCHGNNRINYGLPYDPVHGTSGSSSSHEDLDDTEQCNRCTALRLVRLYVVRERGLPDCATDLLQRPEVFYDLNDLRGAAAADSARSASILRSEKVSRAYGRHDPHTEATAIANNSPGQSTHLELHPDNRIPFQLKKSSSRLSSYKESPHSSEFWRKVDQDSNDIPALSRVDSSIPVALSLTESSSSSEDEEIVRVRRKRRSLSRKGSSSTTSYHSIPDVAASANSSLQRLRNPAIRTSQETSNSPLFTSTNFNSAIIDNTPSSNAARYFSKLTETETCDSVTSSSEENTSENDIEPIQLRPCLNTSDMGEVSRENLITGFPLGAYAPSILSESQGGSVRKRQQKIHPQRRPLSAGMSELFESALTFIDDNNESSEENVRSGPTDLPQRPRAIGLDVPELVKDGTLPRSSSRPRLSVGEGNNGKPDIYPVGSEAGCSYGDQCGQYFFCSLARDKMSKNPNEQKAKKNGTSFSFAINNETPHSTSKNSSNQNGSTNLAFLSDEAIFL